MLSEICLSTVQMALYCYLSCVMLCILWKLELLWAKYWSFQTKGGEGQLALMNIQYKDLSMYKMSFVWINASIPAQLSQPIHPCKLNCCLCCSSVFLMVNMLFWSLVSYGKRRYNQNMHGLSLDLWGCPLSGVKMHPISEYCLWKGGVGKQNIQL